MDLLCVFFSVLCLLCLCARLFICALWSPAGKGLTSWLSFMVYGVSLSLSHWYPGLEVIKLEYKLRLKIKRNIGCLRTRVRKQPIIVLYFESENELKLYNLEAWVRCRE